MQRKMAPPSPAGIISEVLAHWFSPAANRSKPSLFPCCRNPFPAPGSTFTVTLSGPSRGAVGVPSRATVVFFNPDLSTKLMNISTRGPVQTNNDVMIAGFIIQGDAVEQVVLRGIGPSLTPLGVIGAIADPTLALMDANGNQLAFNDDYARIPWPISKRLLRTG